jgi:hypothetical protein
MAARILTGSHSGPAYQATFLTIHRNQASVWPMGLDASTSSAFIRLMMIGPGSSQSRHRSATASVAQFAPSYRPDRPPISWASPSKVAQAFSRAPGDPGSASFASITGAQACASSRPFQATSFDSPEIAASRTRSMVEAISDVTSSFVHGAYRTCSSPHRIHIAAR